MTVLRRVAGTWPIEDAGAVLVRRLLRGRSADEIVARPLLARAARFPIPDGYFELSIPRLEPLWLHGPSVPFVYWAGLEAFEPEVVPGFLEVAAGARVVVDVGANVGVFSLLAWRANPAARVVAVEPNPLTAEVLRQTISRNRAPIEVLELALSNQPGTSRISLEGGLSSIVRDSPYASTAPVRTARLDDLVPAPVDLVKIDAEGAELMVLAGMARTLRESRPVVICEFGADTLAQARGLLAGAGYRALALPGREPVDLDDGRLTGSADLLLLPVER